MTFLELCQRAALECGVSGTISTVTGNTGSLNRIVTWVGQAWSELQTEHDDWGWMRSSNLLGAGMSFVATAGQPSFPLGAGAGTCGVTFSAFGKWDVETFRCYTTAAGTNDETFLDEIPFDSWRNAYMLGANRTVQTRPVAVAIGPDQSVCLGPTADGSFTITADYFRAPTVMTADTDVPTGLSAQFHMLIVYKAMQYYAAYESAPEVKARGDGGWKVLLAQLEAIWGPKVAFSGALC